MTYDVFNVFARLSFTRECTLKISLSHVHEIGLNRWQGVFVNVLEQSPQMKEADDGLLKQGWTSKEVRVSRLLSAFLCI